MPTLEFPLSAAIGEEVLLTLEALSGQVALVVVWRVTRPRFLLGGFLDRAPEVSLQVITEFGDERWLGAAEVTGLGTPAIAGFSLPFMGGDQVLVAPSGARGEVRGWEVIGRRLEMSVVYRVHLAGSPQEEEIEVEAHYLEARAS